MPGSSPVLSNYLKVVVSAIHKLHNSAQRVSDRLQMAIGAVVRRRNVIAVAVFNLSTSILIVDTGWCKRVLSAVSCTNDWSINITNVQLRIAAILRFVNVRRAHLSQLHATARRCHQHVGPDARLRVKESLLQRRETETKARSRRTEIRIELHVRTIPGPYK